MNRKSPSPLAIPLMDHRTAWIYKSAAELGEEIMPSVSESTIRRRIDELVWAGYLDWRPGSHPWEPSPQYRPNVRAIQHALRGRADSWRSTPT